MSPDVFTEGCKQMCPFIEILLYMQLYFFMYFFVFSVKTDLSNADCVDITSYILYFFTLRK